MLIQTRNGLIANDIPDARWNVEAGLEKKKEPVLSEEGIVAVATLTGVTQGNVKSVVCAVDDRIKIVTVQDKFGKTRTCHLEGYQYFSSLFSNL